MNTALQLDLLAVQRLTKYQDFKQMVEHELYCSIRDLTEYDQVYYNPVMTTLGSVVNMYKGKNWIEVVEYANSLVTSIKLEIAGYKAMNPQFKRIAKGIVLNYIAKHSMYFQDLYKPEVKIERQVSYRLDTYTDRLIGYFLWMKKDQYDLEDLEERIVRFNMREKKHVAVEDRSVADSINAYYKIYMKELRSLNKLNKFSIINTLKAASKTCQPAP